MMERAAETSPRVKARVAGALYLVIIVTALFAEVFVRGWLVVNGDAAATAANILAHQPLYRLGGVADLIAFVCDAGVALIFYDLFSPVSGSVSLLAAFFRLVHVAIVGVTTVCHFAPLVFLGEAHYLSAFSRDQLRALAMASLKLHTLGYMVALVFFGFHCVLTGCLIWKSTFLPRTLGTVMAVAGFCYLTNSFASLLSPAIAGHLYPWILLPGALGEWSLTAWLLCVGVRVPSARAVSP